MRVVKVSGSSKAVGRMRIFETINAVGCPKGNRCAIMNTPLYPYVPRTESLCGKRALVRCRVNH